MPYEAIIRDDYVSEFGKFYAMGGGKFVSEKHPGVIVAQPDELKGAFLPKMNERGDHFIRAHGQNFVRAMMQVYQVDYAEDDVKDKTKSTKFLQKMLQEGKLDELPPQIVQLAYEMHLEWLDGLTPEEIAVRPEWVMQKYFLDIDGNPEPTKTTAVIGVPAGRSTGNWPALRAEACKIPGLYCASSKGRRSVEMVYIGWSRADVYKAAREHKAAATGGGKGNENQVQAEPTVNTESGN